jgi:hypothetical protein
MADFGIRIEGLRELRSDMRRAQSRAPSELTKGLKRAGEPAKAEAERTTPHRSGRLAGGYSIQVRGDTGEIINRVPYAAGAHFGRRGKWKGFARYGPAGARFAVQAIDDKADETMELLYDELREIFTVFGWFR